MAHLDEIMRIKGKNLFDKNVDYFRGYPNANNSEFTSNTGTGTYVLKCEPNTTYSLQYDNSTASGTGQARCYVGMCSNTTSPVPGDHLDNYTQPYGNSELKKHEVTFTTAANATYILLWLFHSNWTEALGTAQLEKSSAPTSYESYVGEPINIGGVPGKNLLNMNNLERGRYDDSGNETTDDSCFRTEKLIQVQPNTAYAFQWSGSIASNVVRIIAFDSDGRFISLLQKSTLQSSTVTTPANCTQLGISLGNTATSIQLEQGSTATSYEPYEEHNIWQRAVEKDSTKGISSTFENTRVAINLFDNDNITDGRTIKDNDGSEITYPGASCSTNIIPVKPNTNYINSSSVTSPGNIRWHEYDANGNWITSSAYAINGGTFKTGSTTYGLKYSKNTAKPTVQEYNIQLNEGSTVLPSYPYFAPTQVLPSVKAYGKTIEAKIQEELWGRYVPVEYLESVSNEQEIDTGVIGTTTSGLSVYIDVQGVSGLSGSNVIICGNGGAQAGQWFGHNTGIYTSGTGAASDVPSTDRIQTTVTFGTKVEYTLNGVTYSRTGSLPSIEGATTTLFHSGKKETNSYGGKAKIYKCRIENDGALVRDFIPVKDTLTNKYGLFDRLNKVFYGNAIEGATTDFTGGNELKRIDYLENDGNQYINTGYYGDLNTELNVTCSFNTNGVAQRIAGAYEGTSNSITAVIGTTARFGNKSGSTSTGSYSSNTIYDFVINKTALYKDGTAIVTFNTTNDFTTGSTIKLFRTDDTLTMSGKIYKARIKENDILVCNFIPIKIGSTGYMLDTIEWKLYANAGTGDFVCGPEIPNRLILPYKLYGNKGEIKYGQYGKNMVDSAHGIKAHIKPDGSIQNPTSYSLKCSDYIEVKPSTQYIYSGMGNVSATSVSRTGYLYDKNKNPIQQVSNSTGDPVRFTTTAATKYVIMQWRDTETEVQLEEGGNVTSYEPYHFGLHADDAHKIYLGTQGVIDLGTQNWIYTEPTSTYPNGYFRTTISNKIYGQTSGMFLDGYALQVGTYERDKSIWGNNSASTVFMTDSRFTNSTDLKAFLNGKYLFYQRTTDTTFVPPITKQIQDLLYSANGYKDLQTGNVYQDWGIKVLDGTESWQKANVAFQVKDKFPVDVADRSRTNQPFLNFYTSEYYDTAITTYIQNGEVGFNGSQRLTIRDDRFATVEEFKAYLAEQYANGTPVIIIYPLANPATIAGTADAFKLTTKGNKTLISDVAGTGVQATYLGE